MLFMSDEQSGDGKYQRDYRANGPLLRRLRNRAHLSTKKLGKKAGVDFTTINRIERGHNRSPRWDTLERIAGALNIDDVDKLVIYEDMDELKTPENERKIEETENEWDRKDEELEGEDRGESDDPDNRTS